ncbi:MAG: PepSY domain-containing protein [Candidatus Sericytochromatia bacterium]
MNKDENKQKSSRVIKGRFMLLPALLLSLSLFLSLTDLPVRASEPDKRPLTADTLRQKLQSLQKKGRLISLEYNERRRCYRIGLLSSQGQVLRYELDPASGRLTALAGRQDQPELPIKGLLPLEKLLQQVFGRAHYQLLEAELKWDDAQPVYELEWLQQGRIQEARFDARSGKRLNQEEE